MRPVIRILIGSSIFDMQTEGLLLKKLELQISKIEKFVLDLQQDYQWQKIFYKNELYLNLTQVFNKPYTEYSKYLNEIIEDYKILKSCHGDAIKEYYIEKIENKIFTLFKVLRSLKKYNKKSDDLAYKISIKQQQNAKLSNQKSALEKMLALLNQQYTTLNKQFIYGKTQSDLQKQLMTLLTKKGKLEQELFSLSELIKLNS